MKKVSLRKIAALAASMAMFAMTLAGCGNTASDSGSSTDGTTSAAAASGDDTVKVGLLHSLTGSMAISEKAVRDAEVLAIDEINAAGGVLGKQIVYVEEDGASEPSTFATKAEKLVDYVFPRTANMIITAQVQAAGGEVVGEEYADMDQTDFAAIISKIESAQPEIIINTLNGTGNVSFFKQMAEKNYTSAEYPTMSFSIAEEEVATIGADILKGHMVSWNYYETTDTPENKAFVEAYKAKFGESRVTSDPAEAAYDAVYLWKAACEKAGSFDVDAVREAIAGGDISFNAPEGTVTINGTNQHLTKPVRIGEIRDDGLIYEVYSTPTAVDPDPYLTTYDWAVEAGIQPIE